MKKQLLAATSLLCLVACSTTPQEAAVDLDAVYGVAAAAEADYAAQPGADPARVAQGRQLLAAAQAAILTWNNSQNPTDQTEAAAAVAALVAYQATASQPAH